MLSKKLPKAKGGGKKQGKPHMIIGKKVLDRVTEILSDMTGAGAEGDDERDSWFYFTLFSLHRSPERLRHYMRRVHRLGQQHIDAEESGALFEAAEGFQKKLCEHHKVIEEHLRLLRERIKERYERLLEAKVLVVPHGRRRYPYMIYEGDLISMRTLARRAFAQEVQGYEDLKRRFGAHCLIHSGVRFVAKTLSSLL